MNPGAFIPACAAEWPRRGRSTPRRCAVAPIASKLPHSFPPAGDVSRRRCGRLVVVSRAQAAAEGGGSREEGAVAPPGDAPASRGRDSEDDEVFVLDELDDAEGLDSDALPLEEPKLIGRVMLRHEQGDMRQRGGFRLSDTILLSCVLILVYLLWSTTGSVIHGSYQPQAVSTDIGQIPWYTALSVTRIFFGYLLSLLFSILYAYVAYRVNFAAKVLVLIIDILQSIPLLSFLPGVVLGLMRLFPGQRVGVELAALLLLFTSMAWNMVLGFYQSLLAIPRELQEASAVFRLSSWKRFWTLELPSGAVGLVWNSIMSVAGGWFFLISIESFELGNQDFRLPGIGSFLAAAAERADFRAVWFGLASLVAVIVLADFLIWRPLIDWSAKFTYGSGTSEEGRARSTVRTVLRRSALVRVINERCLEPVWEWFIELDTFSTNRRQRAALQRASAAAASARRNADVTPAAAGATVDHAQAHAPEDARRHAGAQITRALPTVITWTFFATVAYGLWQVAMALSSLSVATWLSLLVDVVYTLGRVIAALVLSLLWTVPVGVAVGRDARLAAKVQPLVQVTASVPATALFPFLLLALARVGGGLQIGSILLMMLGTMWYVLFNVIAGAQAIPSELFEVDKVYGQGNVVKRWRTLVLPGIFPYLITGIVTAVGGAWNASIVSEYVTFQGQVLTTRGLGAVISKAAAMGDYTLLLAGTLLMCLLVLVTNRFVWGPLYDLAENKYKVVQN